MTTQAKNQIEPISECLAQIATGIEHAERTRWKFELVNNNSRQIEASLADDWLLLKACLGPTSPTGNHWEMLYYNGVLDGLCKFALDSQTNSLQLRAELPLDFDQALLDLPLRFAEVCASFDTALGLFNDPNKTKVGVAANNTDPSVMVPQEGNSNLASLLDETEWPCSERSSESYVVDLDVGGKYSQAILEDHGDGVVVAHSEVTDLKSLPPERQEGLGIFLLTSCALVRMARASVVRTNTHDAARFEVRLPSPCPEELNHGLAALSVAMNTHGRESQSFEHDRIAGAFMTVRELNLQV